MTDTVAYLPGEAWLISGATAMVMTEGDAADARLYWNLLRHRASAGDLIAGIGSGPAAGALAVLVWEPAGVRVLEQPFVAHGNVATAGGCLASHYLAAWVIARLAGWDAAESIVDYVAPVGQKREYVERARAVVQQYLPVYEPVAV